MPRKRKQVKPQRVNSGVGPPRWADKEMLGLYCTPRTEQALIECISIRESIGRQLGGYHCANVRLILYKNHSPTALLQRRTMGGDQADCWSDIQVGWRISARRMEVHIHGVLVNVVNFALTLCVDGTIKL